MSVLLQIADSLSVAEGHKSITDQVSVLTVLIAGITIIGLIFIIRYIVKEKSK